MKLLALGALLVLVPGCGGDFVDRESVTTAFAEIEEPLTVRLDMAAADPGSDVDVIFVPPGKTLQSHRSK